jgi:hypothetical protein
MLVLKRTKANAVLGTPLVLQAKEVTSRWHGHGEESVLWYSKERTNFRFYFNDNEGDRRFQDWFRMTQTQPAMRKALKLPPL